MITPAEELPGTEAAKVLEMNVNQSLMTSNHAKSCLHQQDQDRPEEQIFDAYPEEIAKAKDLLRLELYQAIHTLEDIQEDNMTEDAQQQSL